MIGPTDITTILGIKGTGKSFMGKAIASLYPRLVVIDVLKEWTPKDADLVTDSVDEALEFLCESRKQFRLVLQFNVDLPKKEMEETFNRFCRLLYKRGELTGENVCLLIEEVHFYCGSNWIFEWLFKLCTVSRHANMAMILSSQRAASIHKVCVSQAANILVGFHREKNDIAFLRETVGDYAADHAPTLKKYDFILNSMEKPPIIVRAEHISGGKL